MKYSILTVALITLSSASIQANDFSFWQNKKVSKTINNNFILSEGMNLQEFKENFGRSTKEIRRDYIHEAVSLLKAGATGAEAMQMVLAFDDRVYDRRLIAKRGTGKTIANSIRAGIEEFYQRNPRIKSRGVQVVNSSNSDYSANLLWGVYGAYNGKAAIYAMLEVINNSNGISRTFYARTNAQQINIIGHALAFSLLHSYHKTEFPLETNLAGKTYIIDSPFTETFSTYTQLGNQLDFARDVCQANGQKLLGKREISALFSKGIYTGGYSKGDLNRHNWIFEKGAFTRRDPLASRLFSYSSSPFIRTTKFFCAKEKRSNYRW